MAEQNTAEQAPSPVVGEVEPQPQPDVQQPQQPDAFAGIQKRIDELTARYHDSERRASEALLVKEQQISELVSALSSRQAPEPDYAAEVDINDRRKVEAIVSPQVKRLEETVRRMEEAMSQQRFHQAAQQYGDDRITSLAQNIQQEWRKRGFNGPQWTPEVALVHAAGLLHLEEKQKGSKDTRDNRGRFASPQPPVLTNHAAAPSSAPRQSDALPADIDDLIQSDPVRAAALLEKRLVGKKF